MIIPITRNNAELVEWVMVEMQGELEQITTDSEERFIGDLHFTTNNTPMLIIGIHILYGKETTLPKPVIVLEKLQRNEDEEVTDMNTNDHNITTEYVIKAIVKKKIMFKGRPKPIVTDMPISR